MPDPYLTLGIEPGVDDAAVEQAYRDAIKRCPPDRDPAAFQAVRAAYERLRTRRDRVAYELFDAEPPAPLDVLRRALSRPAAAGHERPDAARIEALFAALLRGEE
ncbi:MAG: J domain-containing protein [Thiohalocapsa sp.]|jgi:curved DNA-binding protein CbpA